MTVSKNLRVACSLCAAVGVAVYTSTLDCGFCYDDNSAIVENDDVTGRSQWVQMLWNDFWGKPIYSNVSHKSYRPLCVATFRLNYLLHELQPMGYHLVNVLLHGAVCYLYVQLCGVIFSQVWPALIAGLLFAVHPIHTEAVAGIVGRADLLTAFFFLLSFLSYHKGIVDAHSATGTDSFSPDHHFSSRRHLIHCLMFVLCAVASKELGLTVVGVSLIYDLFIINKVNLCDIWTFFSLHQYKGRSPFSKSFLSRMVPLVVFSAVILIGRLWLMKSAPIFTKYDNEALVLTTPYRQLHWFYLIFLNSYLLLLPSVLVHDYRMGAVPLIKTMTDLRITLITITLFFYSGLLLYSFTNNRLSLSTQQQRTFDINTSGSHMTNDVILNGTAATSNQRSTRKTRKVVKTSTDDLTNSRPIREDTYTNKEVLLFGLSLMIIPFLPASNLFFPVGFVVAERVLYLPSMGFCMLVAYGAHRIIETRLKWLSLVTKLGIFLLILSHGVKTVRRNRDWYSKQTIYKSLIKYYPTNGHMIGNLALEMHRYGDDIMAESLNRYAMKVAPDVPLSFVNFGSLLKQQDRLEEAEQVWRQAILVLAKEEDPKTETIAQLYTSLCAIASGHTSRLYEALELCDLAVTAHSDLPNTHNRRGAVLMKMGRHREAKMAFEEVLRLDPHNANSLFNLALAYENLGDVAVAMEILHHVLAMDPTHQLAKNELRKLVH